MAYFSDLLASPSKNTSPMGENKQPSPLAYFSELFASGSTHTRPGEVEKQPPRVDVEVQRKQRRKFKDQVICQILALLQKWEGNPFDRGSRVWTWIADKLQEISPNADFSPRAIRDKVTRMISDRKRVVAKNLRSSGISENPTAQDQVLDNLVLKSKEVEYKKGLKEEQKKRDKEEGAKRRKRTLQRSSQREREEEEDDEEEKEHASGSSRGNKRRRKKDEVMMLVVKRLVLQERELELRKLELEERKLEREERKLELEVRKLELERMRQ